MVETEGTRRGRVVGRGLGLIADHRPVSSCCSHHVFVEWARRALSPCLHCHIVVIAATLLQAWFRLGLGWCSFCGVTAVLLLIVVGSVVVMVLCHGVGVMVWWGSRCVMVMRLSCGDMVVMWSL